MARYKTRSVTVQCEGECWIEDFETDVLVEELQRRNAEIETKRDQEGLVDVHEAILDGRVDDAQILLERLIWPKWKSIEECEAAARALKKAQ